ncbi:unnamed protein product [Brassica oleracea var. botrytis]
MVDISFGLHTFSTSRYASRGRGNKSGGDNFHAAPNIDRSQDFVRRDIKNWLRWMRLTFRSIREAVPSRPSTANEPPTPALSVRGPHPIPTAGPLIFTDAQNYCYCHMTIFRALGSLTRYRETLPDRSPILSLLQPKHA